MKENQQGYSILDSAMLRVQMFDIYDSLQRKRYASLQSTILENNILTCKVGAGNWRIIHLNKSYLVLKQAKAKPNSCAENKVTHKSSVITATWCTNLLIFPF